ncbi:MAG: (2Fe-2S)-binding protein [Candidatus Eisenbacteria bacterium]
MSARSGQGGRSRATRKAAPAAVRRVALRLTVNGRVARVRVPPMKRLLDVLREELRLTGSKEGCGEGECGACSVLLDGAVVNACLVPVVQCDGRRIVTVEGLARGGGLGVLQRAFVEMGGAQCGICTPGMLVAAHALIARRPGHVPGDEEVREALAGNLCRCTGYQKIVDAVRAAAGPGRAPRRPDRPRPRRVATRPSAAAPGRARTRRKVGRATR